MSKQLIMIEVDWRYLDKVAGFLELVKLPVSEGEKEHPRQEELEAMLEVTREYLAQAKRKPRTEQELIWDLQAEINGWTGIRMSYEQAAELVATSDKLAQEMRQYNEVDTVVRELACSAIGCKLAWQPWPKYGDGLEVWTEFRQKRKIGLDREGWQYDPAHEIWKEHQP